MVHKNQLIGLLSKLIFNCVAQLFRRIRFTRRNAAGNHPMRRKATRKTSITISGEYRKEENERNGNSSGT